MKRLTLFLALCWITPAAFADCNTAPLAVNDEVDAPRGRDTLLIDVLANDSADGQALEVAAEGGSCAGTLSVEYATLVFAPSPAVQVDCELFYRITDEDGLSVTGTVAVKAPEHDGMIFWDAFESGNMAAWSN